MVDMELLKERAMKGAYVGAGSFAASFVEQTLQNNLQTSDLVTSTLQLGAGLGMSVGVDMVFDDPDSLPNDFVEYGGYGVQAAAWNDLADNIATPTQTARSVSVSTDGSGRQTGQRARVVNVNETGSSDSGGSSGTDTPFAADVA